MESNNASRRLRTLANIPENAPLDGGAWAAPILFPGAVIAYRSALEALGLIPPSKDNPVQVGGRPRFAPVSFRGAFFTWVPDVPAEDTVPAGCQGYHLRCSSPEEALVGCIRKIDLAGGPDALAGILSAIRPGSLDFRRIEDILDRCSNKSLWQRTGYLVSLFQDNLVPPARFSWLCREKAWGVRSVIPAKGKMTFIPQWGLTVPEVLTRIHTDTAVIGGMETK